MDDTLAAAALGDQNTRRALHELARHYIEWLSDRAEDDHRRVTVQVWAEALRNDRVAGIVRAGVDQRLPCCRSFSALCSNGHGTPAWRSAIIESCSMQ